MDQVPFTWDTTPYAETRSARPAPRRSPWGGPTVAVIRLIAFLVVATVAILVLLPAAIAAQAVFTV